MQGLRCNASRFSCVYLKCVTRALAVLRWLLLHIVLADDNLNTLLLCLYQHLPLLHNHNTTNTTQHCTLRPAPTPIFFAQVLESHSVLLTYKHRRPTPASPPHRFQTLRKPLNSPSSSLSLSSSSKLYISSADMSQIRGTAGYHLGPDNRPFGGPSSNSATSDPSPLDAIRAQTNKIEDLLDTLADPVKP